ncbi:hypothetical protein HJ588_01500 [Flexivirga sp. ID2601S]|uniref:PqqD family peptide modification chaperone n=1 Tax=Flexivirga aerilata TaxID=1656889 RepID=A0A849AFD8_9MICO|nr:hypothetical protein [Flexivirga aerilata]NNG37951.1 hypothetical protein [Flexivirga aerilata]
MTGDVRLSVLGSVFSVPGAADDLARWRSQWSRCLAADGATPVERVRPADQEDPDRLDYSLASALTMAGIQQAAGSRLMLHACGAADPATGDVAVLVAASGTGKTTAAHRLCGAAGFGYVTDETVSIGEGLDVLPYPKPLSVVIATDDPGHKSQHGPDELGLAPCPPDPHATRFVLLQRDAAAGDPVTLEQLPLLDGLLELIPHTSALPAMPQPLWTLASAVAATGGVWRLHYREIDDAAGTVREALRARPTEPAHLQHHGAMGADTVPDRYFRLPEPPGDERDDETGRLDDRETAESLETPGLVRRTPYTDAVSIDGEVLLLVGASPVRLSGLGATIWVQSAEDTPLEELVGACVAEHGDHPDAAGLVRAAVRSMRDHGVLDGAPAGAVTQSASRGTSSSSRPAI